MATVKVENADRYAGYKNRAGRNVRGIADKLTEGALGYGITDQHLAMFMSASPDERAAVMELLQGQMAPHIRSGVGVDEDKARKFTNMFSRVAFLGGFEGERQPGMHVAQQAAGTIWDRGRSDDGKPITLKDVMGADGKFAPMTPVGAAAGDPDAVKVSHERVGNIFAHLMAAAKAQQRIVATGGYNLADLGHAVHMWLAEHLRPIQNERELAAASIILQGELMAFLASYNRA